MSNTNHMIPFGSDTILAFEEGQQLYVAVRPICERLGINFASQTAKLNTDHHRYGVAMIATPHNRQPMLCLPKGKLFGWLNSIHPSKVAEKARPALARYQAESDAVLDAYWSSRFGMRADPVGSDIDVSSGRALMEIATAVKLLVERSNWMDERIVALELDNQGLKDFQSRTALPVLRISPREAEIAPYDLQRAKLRSSQRITPRDKKEITALHMAGFSVIDIGNAMNMSKPLVRKIKRILELHGQLAPDPRLKEQRKQLIRNIESKPRPRKTLDPHRADLYQQRSFGFATGGAA